MTHVKKITTSYGEVEIPSYDYPVVFPQDMKYDYGYIKDFDLLQNSKYKDYMPFRYKDDQGNYQAAYISNSSYNTLIDDINATNEKEYVDNIRHKLSEVGKNNVGYHFSSVLPEVIQGNYEEPYLERDSIVIPDMLMLERSDFHKNIPTPYGTPNHQPRMSKDVLDIEFHDWTERKHVVKSTKNKVTPELLDAMTYAYGKVWEQKNNIQSNNPLPAGIYSGDYDTDDNLSRTVGWLLSENKKKQDDTLKTYDGLGIYQENVLREQYKNDIEKQIQNIKLPTLSGDVILAYFDGVDALSPRSKKEFYEQFNIKKDAPTKAVNLYLKKAIIGDLCNTVGKDYKYQWDQYYKHLEYNPSDPDLADKIDMFDQLYEYFVTEHFQFKSKDNKAALQKIDQVAKERGLVPTIQNPAALLGLTANNTDQNKTDYEIYSDYKRKRKELPPPVAGDIQYYTKRPLPRIKTQTHNNLSTQETKQALENLKLYLKDYQAAQKELQAIWKGEDYNGSEYIAKLGREFYNLKWSIEKKSIEHIILKELRETDPEFIDIANYSLLNNTQAEEKYKLTQKLIDSYDERLNDSKGLLSVQNEVKEIEKTLQVDYFNATEKLYTLDVRIKDNKYRRVETTYNNMSDEEKQAYGNDFKETYMSAIPMFKQYLGTDKITFSNADYQRIGLEFQKKLIYNGEEEAFNYLQSAVKNHVADNMGAWETFINTCMDWWDTFATDVMYLPAMLGGYVYQSFKEGSWEISNFAENPATEYLTNIVTTGSWDPSLQQHYLTTGTNEHTVWSDEQDEAFFSWKTVNTLATQTAHLAGFPIGSSIASKVTKPIFKNLAKYSTKVGKTAQMWRQGTKGIPIDQISQVVNRAADMGKFEKVAAKRGAWAGIVSQTAVESTMEATGVAQEIKMMSENDILKYTNNNYEAHIEEKLQEDPQQFALLYTHVTGNQLPDMETHYYENLKTLRSFMYNNENYKQQYLTEHPEVQQEIEKRKNAAVNSAHDAMAITFALDMVLGSVTNGMLQKGLLSKDMQKALQGSSGKYMKIGKNEAGDWVASSTRSKLKPLKDNVLEIGSQFYEEYQQGINSSIGVKLGEQFYNDEVIKGCATDFVDALAVAFEAGSEAAISKETLYEGLIGMFSSIIGTPTFKSNRNTAPRGANESWLHYIHRKNPIGWRSPVIDAFGKNEEYQEEVKREQEILNFVNSYFSDERHQQLLFDGVRRVQVLKNLTLAEASGDPKAIKDAQVDVVYESAAFIVSLKGSEYYDSVLKTLKDQSAITIENLQDENSLESQLVFQFLQIPGNQDVTGEEAINTMKASASQMLDMITETDKIYKEVEKSLNLADPQLIFYTVKKKVLYNQAVKQQEELKKQIQEYKNQLPEGPKSKLSDDNINFLLEYGSIKNAEQFLSKSKIEANAKILKLKEDLKVASKQQKLLLNTEIKMIEKTIEDLEKHISTNREQIEAIPENERTYSIRDLLNFKINAGFVHNNIQTKTQVENATGNLNTKAAIINEETPSLTEEQKEKFKSSEVVSTEADLSELPDHIKQAISHIAAYDEEIAQQEQELVQLFTEPQKAINSFQQARRDVASRIVRYKFSDLEDPNLSYENFFSKFYNYYNSESTTAQEKKLMLEAVENSPHKKQLEEDIKAHNLFMRSVITQEAYKNLSQNEQANVITALEYLFQHQIPIDENANIDEVFSALSHISAEDFLAHLQKNETFEGQYKVESMDKVASSIKSVFDGVNTTKQEVEERVKEHEGIVAEEATTPVVSEESTTPTEEGKVIKEMEDIVEENQKRNQEIVNEISENSNEHTPNENNEQVQEEDTQTQSVDNSFFGHYKTHQKQVPEQHSQVVDTFFSALQEKIEKEKQKNPQLTDEDVDDIIQTAIAGISIKSKKAAVKQVYNEVEKARKGKGRSSDSANQQITLESTDPVERQYLQDRKTKNTLGTAKITNGTEFYFYSPKELSGTQRPVAVLIKDNKGDVVIKGQRYSVVGTTTKSEAMEKENPNNEVDFLYSQKGKATHVSKEAYDKGMHKTTNVKEIVGKEGEPSSTDVASGVTLSKDRISKKGNSYSQYVFNLHRGRGQDALEIEMYVSDISTVKDNEGKTLFDKLKDFINTTFSSKTDEAIAAAEISRFNYRVQQGTRILKEGLNELTDLLIEDGVLKGKELDPANYNEQLNNLYKAFVSYLNMAGNTIYTFNISDIVVENNTFSFTLNLSDGETTMPLTRISNVGIRQRVYISDTINILYHLSHDNNGDIIKVKEEQEDGTIREYSFLKWNVHYSEKPNINTLAKDIDSGMFEINHTTFNYPATEIGLAFVMEQPQQEESAQIQTTEEKVTDNTTPAQGISITPTTVDGKAVNEDTGYSPESKEEILVDPNDLLEENSLSEDSIFEDDELQLVQTRKSLITSIKEKISNLLFDSTSKQEYNDWVDSARQEYQNDTKVNAFSQSKKQTLKEARKTAEKRAKEILANKDPRIKNIRVVRSSPLGYALQIEYNSYDKYVSSEMSKLHSLDTGTLTGINDRLQETKSIIKATQKQAEERLSWFTRFKQGNLYKAYKKLMGTQVDSRMESLVKQLLQSYNFKVVEKALGTVHGKDIAGKLDTIGKIVYLAQEANRNKLTSVEELAHVIVNTILEENTKETQQLQGLLKELMLDVENTEFYTETEKDYSDIEKYDLKKEAVAKALATAITLRYNKNNSFASKLSLFISDVIMFFKSLLEKSGLSKGTDAILQYKLNTIAKNLLDSKVQSMENSSIDTVFTANKLSNKKQYQESSRMQEKKAKLKEVQKTSSAVGIQYKLLGTQIKKYLNLKNISQQLWESLPFGLQDNILHCITKR